MTWRRFPVTGSRPVLARNALAADAQDRATRAAVTAAAAADAMSEAEILARLREIRDEADRRLALAEEST